MSPLLSAALCIIDRVSEAPGRQESATNVALKTCAWHGHLENPMLAMIGTPRLANNPQVPAQSTP
jgi:hypothetical protein